MLPPVHFLVSLDIAHTWRRRTDTGKARAITDLAAQKDVKAAYVCRLLPLTCVAPDLVEAIIDGRQPRGLRLAEMLGNGPTSWEEQRRTFVPASLMITGRCRSAASRQALFDSILDERKTSCVFVPALLLPQKADDLSSLNRLLRHRPFPPFDGLHDQARERKGVRSPVSRLTHRYQGGTTSPRHPHPF
jgi:hypothetical protein